MCFRWVLYILTSVYDVYVIRIYVCIYVYSYIRMHLRSRVCRQQEELGWGGVEHRAVRVKRVTRVVSPHLPLSLFLQFIPTPIFFPGNCFHAHTNSHCTALSSLQKYQIQKYPPNTRPISKIIQNYKDQECQRYKLVIFHFPLFFRFNVWISQNKSSNFVKQLLSIMCPALYYK